MAGSPRDTRALVAVCGAAVGAAAVALLPGRWGQEPFFAPKTFVVAACAVAAVWLLRGAAASITLTGGAVAIAMTIGAVSWLVHPGDPWMGAAALSQSAALLVLALAARRAVESDGAALEAILDVCIAAACAVALVAVAEALGMPSLGSGLRRPEATLGNRNFVGAFAAITLPLAIARLVQRPGLLRTGAVWLLTLVVALCRTRSAWLGLLAAAIGAASLAPIARWQVGRAVWMRAVASIAAALLCAALLPWPGLRWREASPLRASLARLVSTEGTGGDRLREDRIALAVAASHPWLGVGPRNWSDAAAEFAHSIPGGHARPSSLDLTPHSDLVRVLAEDGVIALAAWVIAFAWAAAQAVRSIRAADAALWGACAALVVAGMHALLDSPLYRPDAAVLIAVLAGAVRGRTAPSSRGWHVPAAARSAGLAVLAGCALGIGSLRVAAAWQVRDRSSVDSMQASQRIFPHSALGEQMALELARQGRCAQAAPELARVMTWFPHHWHVALQAARCAQALGDRDLAGEWTRQALAVEPHRLETP